MSVEYLAMKTWKPHPLDLTIVETLERKGPMTDEELLDLLKETNEDLGFGAFNQIYVSSLTKGRRRVELVKRKESQY